MIEEGRSEDVDLSGRSVLWLIDLPEVAGGSAAGHGGRA
jgi:hypothetical protein